MESDDVKSNHENIIKKAAATLSCSEKQVILKRIKAAIKRCFSKKGVLKIETSHYGLYNI